MLYIFLDESGNFDFSGKPGKRYFFLSSLSASRPFPAAQQLLDLKYDLWESGSQLECFHASPDKQWVRDKVFEIVCNHLDQFRVDSIVVDKSKVYPALQKDISRFYKKFLDILLNFVLGGHSWKSEDKIVIVLSSIDSVPKKSAFERAIKSTLNEWANKYNSEYFVHHVYAKSEINLQIVDYITWAIAKKWEHSDTRSYDLVKSCIKSEFDVLGGQ